MTDLRSIKPINEQHAQSIQKCIRSEELEPEIIKLAGQINAADYRFIKLLAEFDDNDGWWGDGIKSFAHWLNYKIGLNTVVAREKVRVARALPDLPLVDEAFRLGKLSYSKVKAITRIATPENESFLLMIAEYGTANHIEMLVRKFRYCKLINNEIGEGEWKKCRRLHHHVDDNGMVVINARLPAEEGAVILKAIETVRERLRHERGETSEQLVQQRNANENDSENVSAETFQRDPEPPDIPHDQATALTHIAEHFLETADDATPRTSLSEKYQVMLHINANAAHIDHKISQGPGCAIENKHFLTPEVAQRLACDSQLRVVLEDDDGKVLDIGRRSGTIPRKIALALNIRDNGCRFPGCCQTRTDAHHVEHWMAGGETKLDNLISLCRTHHGMLHKGDFSIRVQDQDFVFINSNNEVIKRSIHPQFPIVEAQDRLQDLLADQRHLVIDDETARTKWRGETMDLSMAIHVLYDAEGTD